MAYVLLVVIGIFSSDSYLPSLPSIAHALHASRADAKLTVSFYLYGFAVMPLFYGPFSDRLGRQKVLFFGLTVALVASALCIVARDIYELIALRLLQGMGVAGGMSVGRILVTDVFKGRTLAKVSTYFAMFIGITPSIAPTIGGYVQSAWGWRANFAVIFFLILAVFVLLVFVLPETNRHLNPKATRPSVFFKNYARLISNRAFIVYPIITAASFGGVMAYLTAAPFLFQRVLDLTPIEFGWLSAFTSMAIIMGAIINNRLLRRYEPVMIVPFGVVLTAIATVLLLVTGFLGVVTVWAVLLSLMIYITGMQLILGNAFSLGMAAIDSRTAKDNVRGSAAALFTVGQMGGAAIASSIMAAAVISSQLPIAYLWAGLVLINVLILCVVLTHNKAS
jgi:MFS transporter, DHA1 family, 2-module integral membrane pump EmrD